VKNCLLSSLPRLWNRRRETFTCTDFGLGVEVAEKNT
jgi:hypothetical protein